MIDYDFSLNSIVKSRRTIVFPLISVREIETDVGFPINAVQKFETDYHFYWKLTADGSFWLDFKLHLG